MAVSKDEILDAISNMSVMQVVELIATGMRNKEIAGVLNISEETVQAHVKNILAKLKVPDRTAAVTKALRRGMIHIR